MSNTIRRIGDDLLVPVSEEMLAGLGLSEGDEIVAKAHDGVVELSAPGPDFERRMQLADEIMDEYAEALAELAR